MATPEKNIFASNLPVASEAANLNHCLEQPGVASAFGTSWLEGIVLEGLMINKIINIIYFSSWHRKKKARPKKMIFWIFLNTTFQLNTTRLKTKNNNIFFPTNQNAIFGPEGSCFTLENQHFQQSSVATVTLFNTVACQHLTFTRDLASRGHQTGTAWPI